MNEGSKKKAKQIDKSDSAMVVEDEQRNDKRALARKRHIVLLAQNQKGLENINWNDGQLASDLQECTAVALGRLSPDTAPHSPPSPPVPPCSPFVALFTGDFPIALRGLLGGAREGSLHWSLSLYGVPVHTPAPLHLSSLVSASSSCMAKGPRSTESVTPMIT